jgi:hypothetical protein
MAHRDTLNEEQAKVLEWIGLGCPRDGQEGVERRITAAALVRRGLVSVEGRGPSWSATITTDGRAYLDRMASERPPVPRQPNVSVTQQLVEEVIAAGGVMTFPRPRYGVAGEVDFERRAALAHRFGKVPPGKQLVVTRHRDELEIGLVDSPQEVPAVPEVVKVPGRVARFHPLVTTFRTDTSRHEVSRAQLGRASRLIHVLVTEAERRGHLVKAAPSSTPRYGQPRWSGPSDGHIVITAGECSASLRIFEEGLGSRSHWEQENLQRVRTSTGVYLPRGRPVADYESKASGRLCIELLGFYRNTYRAHRWADRRSWRLEDKVGEVLWEIEVRSAESRIAREAAELEASQREGRWHAAMLQAEADLTEHRRGEAAKGQAAAWADAERIRAYCSAMTDRYSDDQQSLDWATWARAFADRIDPLASAPEIPQPGDISPEDLRPFLRGWNPYGPDRR